MKCLVLFLFLVTSIISAQELLLEENFDYNVGNLVPTNPITNWVTYDGTQGDIQVVSGSLSFSGYSSSGFYNSIIIRNSSSAKQTEDIRRNFETQATGTVYCSFLVNFSNPTYASGGTYFFGLAANGSSTMMGRIFVKRENSSSESSVAFGLNKKGETTVWTSFDYSKNTTYLLVLKYTFNDESNTDDIVELFIFKEGISFLAEPDRATLKATGGGTDTEIGAVLIREGSETFDGTIDGIRVSTSWNQAPLPVELVFFNTTNVNNNVILNWQTATEVNNYGFDVQRAIEQSKYETIGFVEGHGNSNSPKEYEFIDSNPPSGNLEYRLKQIDTDGSFEYFNLTAKVENQVTDVNEALLPNRFELSQNFPNPFNPTTLIKYEIPKNGNVELKVFDMLGEEVATIVDEVKNAGVHYVHFNATELSSGVYIYALKFGNYYKAKKLSLIY